MIVTNAAIERSTTVFVLLLLIFLLGIYSYMVLPREADPEVVIPYVIVTTTYEGVAPEDMENLITLPIERKLTGLSGVKEITSQSSEGVSSITIEFTPDVLIEDAMQRVRDKVDLAKPDIPEEAEDPMVSEINISELPIMFLSLTGEVGLPALTRLAEELEDTIEAVPGVLDVDIVGDVEREIRIEVDPDRVAEYGVTMGELVALMRRENVNTPGGVMELGEAKYLVRTPGEFSTPGEISDLVVKATAEGVVYVRDIATITDGFKEITSLSRVNGKQAVTLTVSKRAGENVIFIADTIKHIAQRARDRLLPGMELHITMDNSEYIRDMVAELENGVLSGLILVLVVVFVFLGLSNALFVSLAIPVSMLITFTILHASGVSLNIVVLFSLIIALGMLVDNGIVVVENIYRHAQMGKPRLAAAREGASEVAWPITASTLTTVAAFAPMFFWPGIWGDFMIYLPATVSLALFGSLFVGLVVNPSLASVFMRTHRRESSETPQKHHPVLSVYAAVLRTALRWRAVTIVLAVTLLFVITAVFFASATTEFVPTTEPSAANIDVDLPEGANLEATDAIVRHIESKLGAYAENVDFVTANIGSRGVQVFGGAGGATTHIGRVALDFPKLEDCPVLPSETIRQLRSNFTDVAGAEIRIDREQMGPPAGPPVNIEVSGDDFATLSQLADEIKRTIKDIPNLVDLQDDYETGKPELRIHVDRQQATLAGLSTQQIGYIVKAAVNGVKAGEFREGDEEYDVVVRFPETFRHDLRNLTDMTMVNQYNQAVPFGAVVDVEQAGGLGTLKRIDRRRTVTVSGDVEGRSGAEVLKDVQQVLSDFPLPEGYVLSYTGEDEDMRETQAFLGKAFIVALLLIALVLVTQFNSIIQPLIIMSAVILSLAGVFFGLWICNMPFGILMSGIGCISLAGVVVNNGIVLIDFINQLRARGMAVEDAIIEAGVTRFRPVMLTAVTTILGLIPMAVGISFDFRRGRWIIGGEMSQWWGPMAVSIIFGLSFATLLTLVVVPTLYSLGASWHRFVFRDNP